MTTRMLPRLTDLLLQCLRAPARMRELSPAEWDGLVRLARSADLLGRLGALASGHGLLADLPDGPRAHLQAGLRLAAAQHAEVHRELGFILEALAPLQVPVVALKGAAYVMGGLSAAQGRTFSDIDILVPRSHLLEVESRLMQHGWMALEHTAYDDRYYRQWMHELPPLLHIQRESSLDVHHNILPLTARYRPDAELLLQHIVPVTSQPGLYLLDFPDLVLHSLTHMVCNEEHGHTLRDLSDLDLLLRPYAKDEAFWRTLAARAYELDLQRPLYHGLQAAADVLGTPVPPWLLAGLPGPGPVTRRLMRALWRQAARPRHPLADDAWTPVALFALYLRGHWLRMPPWLLTRHLATKAVMRLRGETVSGTQPA
jgi:hypothetical protein